MKKLYSVSLFCLSVLLFGQTEISIGDGTLTDTDYGPLSFYYAYSYKQIIYDAEDIGVEGDIKQLKFSIHGDSTVENSDDHIDIWLGHTTKNEFSSHTDWVPLEGLTQVVTDGSIEVKKDENVIITLDTPFHYNGVDNLVLVVDSNEQNFDDEYYKFYYTDKGRYVSLQSFKDDVNPDPMNPQSGTITTYIPNTTLVLEQSNASTTEVGSDFSFSYYPNPVQEKLKLNSERTIQYIEFYDLLGNLVMTKKGLDAKKVEVDVTALSPGAYMVKALMGGKTKVFKVVKE